MQIIIAGSGTLHLGRQGEDLARQVRFPAGKYRELYGEGSFALAVRRETDLFPYDVDVTADDTWVYWNLTDEDTAVAGIGSCELQYYADGVLAKSQTWRTRVYASASDPGQRPPEPYVTWAEHMTQMIEEAAGTASEAEDSAADSAEAAQIAQADAEAAKAAAQISAQTAAEAEATADAKADAAALSAAAAAASEASAAESAAEAGAWAADAAASEAVARAAGTTAEAARTAAAQSAQSAEASAATATSQATAAGRSAIAAAGSADGAADSAAEAEASASTASDAAATAVRNAATAEASAESAASDEEAARSSRTVAQQSAQSAEASAATALAQATAAGISAAAAAGSAAGAVDSATEAEASASIASDAAETATAKAGEAAASAATVGAAAQTATAKAGEASASAAAAAASEETTQAAKTAAEAARTAAQTSAQSAAASEAAARLFAGAPRTAATAAAMTDTSLIYVYTGSETGYTAGNWYYHDGTAWASGGVYNSTAYETDATLEVSGRAADAAATGTAVKNAWSLGGVSQIANETDYDGLTTPGTYRVSSAGNAGTMINCPVSVAHRLVVQRLVGTSAVDCLQVLITNSNLIYSRSRGSGGWNTWYRLARTTDVTAAADAAAAASETAAAAVETAAAAEETAAEAAADTAALGTRLAKVFDLATGNATAIPEDADINSYRTPGNYKITSTAIANSVSNLPVTAAGRLIVATTFHTSRFIQIWLTATGSTVAYRFGDNSSWNSWRIVNQIDMPDNGETVLILGDSWADEATSGATKWPTYFAKAVKSDIRNYAKNGASVYGSDDYRANGTIGGQVAAAIEDTTYVHDTVSMIFLVGGLNDYRAGRTAANVALAWASLITRLQTGFPNARIVVCLNNQIFVDTDQLGYLRDCALEIRKLGVPCYTMLGWFPASMYNSDHAHPSVTAHGIIAANMVALYTGGPVNYVQNRYTASDPGSGITALTVTEFFSDSRITRRFEVAKSATAAAATQAMTIQNTAGLALNVPFAAVLGKTAADAAFIFAAGTSPDSSEESHKMASTNELTITLPVTGAGTYAGETAV